ncbi:MAG: DUF4430 domain-containing protein [Oscillospiraceae bacterium]|nr:DUF4430 domain-containing protein [Oscillospiraceae bacterium]
MKSKILAIISCIITALLLVINISAEEPSAIYDSIISFKLNECGTETVQEWIDTELSENAGKTSEWYVIALSQIGNYNFSEYKTALENYLENNTVRSATSRQKYALALLAVGSSSDYITETMENSIGEQGIMSYVYGLHLLNNGCTSSAYTPESVVEQILSMQFSDGGWAVMGEYGDPDVTAMTIQALAPYYSTDEKVKNAVDGAVQFLSDKQLENGGYKSMGKETSETISQAITALSALEIDAETDSRFAKNGNTLFSALENFRLDNGSFCHEIGSDGNHTATVQAFIASVAYDKMKNIYILENGGSQKEISAEITENKTEITGNTAETLGNETEMTVASDPQKTKSISYKPVVCIIIVGAAILTCAVLWIAKKRNKKNFIIVAVVSVAALLVVLFTEFSSAEDYYGTASEKQNPIGTVTLEIRCDTVAGRKDYIPENGIILAETEFVFEKDETVYDILVEACRENNIQTEFSGGYISGMNYIYEFDFGDLSGWLYYVNGKEASVGCDSYTLSDGDEIKWLYTCEMGNDLK